MYKQMGEGKRVKQENTHRSTFVRITDLLGAVQKDDS